LPVRERSDDDDIGNVLDITAACPRGVNDSLGTTPIDAGAAWQGATPAPPVGLTWTGDVAASIGSNHRAPKGRTLAPSGCKPCALDSTPFDNPLQRRAFADGPPLASASGDD
jgi:hypothetical protein